MRILIAGLLAFMQQPVPLTSADVAAIVTTSIDLVLKDAHAQPRHGNRSLWVDMDNSNAAFEAFAQRELPILHEKWLPGRGHEAKHASEALVCREPGSINATCRVAGEATFIQIAEVRGSDALADVEVRLRVVWNEPLGAGSRLTGVDAWVRLRKSNGTWSAHLLRAAVG